MFRKKNGQQDKEQKKEKKEKKHFHDHVVGTPGPQNLAPVSPATEKHLKKIDEIERVIRDNKLPLRAEDQGILLRDLSTIRHLVSQPNYDQTDVLQKLEALDQKVTKFRRELVDKTKEELLGKIQDKFKEGENIEELKRKTEEMEGNIQLFARRSPPQKKSFFASMLCCFPCCGNNDTDEINDKQPLLSHRPI